MVAWLRRVWPSRLRGQLILAVAGVHAVLMTVFVWDVNTQQKDHLLRLQATQAEAMTYSLAVSAAGWLAAHDIAGLQEIVEAQQRYPELRYAMLLDRRGRVLAHTDRTRWGQYVRDLPGQGTTVTIRQFAGLLDATAAAHVEGVQVGWVRVGLGQSAMAARVAAYTRDGLVYASVAIAIGVILAALMGTWVTAKLRAIQHVSAAVRGGRSDERVALRGDDEVADLGRAFNRMLDGLREQDSERRRAEDMLRASEQRVRLLLDSTEEGIYGVDDTGHCTFVNRASLGLLGYERDEELLGRRMHDVIHSHRADGSELPAADCRIDAAILTATSVHVDDEVFLRRDGTSFPVECASYPMLREGRSVGAVVSFRDITERQRVAVERESLESQLRQSQKMEAVGRLAGGVAHDLNNILTVILGNMSLLAMEEIDEAERADFLEQVRLAGERAVGLTRRLLTFSRRTPAEFAESDLCEIVRGLSGMLRRILGEDIRFDVVLPDEPLRMRADVGLIEQVVVNLAVNARDALHAGGQFILSVERVDVTPDMARAHAEAQAGPMVCLTARDTGVGIPPDVLPRIFEPFFTTKDVGKGTGLGLSIVYGIVQQHHGWIQVDSRVGEGATLRLYFPRIEHASPVSPEAMAPPRATGAEGRETILLVEDDGAVRAVARTTLERRGYRVLEARSGPDALEVWHRHRTEIDLLLTDVVMPDGMSGSDLAHRIRADMPAMPVVFCSGYTGDGREPESLRGKGVVFIAKPYDPNRLATVVRHALDAREDSTGSVANVR